MYNILLSWRYMLRIGMGANQLISQNLGQTWVVLGLRNWCLGKICSLNIYQTSSFLVWSLGAVWTLSMGSAALLPCTTPINRQWGGAWDSWASRTEGEKWTLEGTSPPYLTLWLCSPLKVVGRKTRGLNEPCFWAMLPLSKSWPRWAFLGDPPPFLLVVPYHSQEKKLLVYLGTSCLFKVLGCERGKCWGGGNAWKHGIPTNTGGSGKPKIVTEEDIAWNSCKCFPSGSYWGQMLFVTVQFAIYLQSVS